MPAHRAAHSSLSPRRSGVLLFVSHYHVSYLRVAGFSCHFSPAIQFPATAFTGTTTVVKFPECSSHPTFLHVTSIKHTWPGPGAYMTSPCLKLISHVRWSTCRVVTSEFEFEIKRLKYVRLNRRDWLGELPEEFRFWKGLGEQKAKFCKKSWGAERKKTKL